VREAGAIHPQEKELMMEYRENPNAARLHEIGYALISLGRALRRYRPETDNGDLRPAFRIASRIEDCRHFAVSDKLICALRDEVGPLPELAEIGTWPQVMRSVEKLVGVKAD